MLSGRLALFYWSGGVWLVLLLVLPAALPILVRFLPDNFGFLGVVAPAFAACLAIGWLFWRTRRTFLRRLRLHWLAVCPTCLYPLKMESGRCPECGRAITRRYARMFWFGILFTPVNVFKSESKVLRDGRIWRDHRRERIRIMNWRFGPLARRHRETPGQPPSMS